MYFKPDLIVRRLHYDRSTGVFRWRVNAKGVKAGGVAGSHTAKGYIQIGLNGVNCLAHRLAWIYCCGYLPKDVDIDHYNGIKDDNRFANLRCCGDRADNSHNVRRARDTSKTGMLGASPVPGSTKFKAQIGVRGERHRLGHFDTAEEAHAAYVKAKRQLHRFNTL